MIKLFDVEFCNWNGGVVYIDIIAKTWRHRLQGMDHYWFTEDCFGMFNSTDQYSKNSRESVFYRVIDNGDSYIDVGDIKPKATTKIYDGIMLPDELAKEYGLL